MKMEMQHMMEILLARLDTNHKMTENIGAETKAIRAETKAMRDKRMEATDLKGNPEEMECESKHWEVPKEDAIVKLFKGQKKRHRCQKLTAR
jgi:hypothetical protein